MTTVNQTLNKSSAIVSVVLVTPDSFETVHKTVLKLRAQTARDKIELVLVAPSRQRLALPEGALDGFAASRVVEVGERRLMAQARALGAQATTTPIVAYAEDHCFPEAGWAAAILEAHAGPYAAVGPRFGNANPRTALSWADYLLNFGTWGEPGDSREVDYLPWHNTSYKRVCLEGYGSKLSRLLEVEGALLDDLKQRGEKLYLQTSAHVHHLNMSRASSLARALYHSGRLFGGMRSRGWNPVYRLIYLLASPLIPLTRLPGQLSHLKRHIDSGAVSSQAVRPIVGWLVLGSLFHVMGEFVGYLYGPGNAPRRKSEFESHRLRHLCRADLEAEYSSLRELA